MKVSRRFQLAVHAILFIAVYSDRQNLTCESISKQMNCNPVVIKNVLNLLYKNNFLVKSSTTMGIKLKKDIKDISLWDIYKVTDEVDIKSIFTYDDLQVTNPFAEDLPELLSDQFEQIMSFIEDTLSKVSIETLLIQYNYNKI